MFKIALSLPIPPMAKRGPKGPRFDNRELVSEAALKIKAGYYKNPRAAVEALVDRYLSARSVEKQSKRAMFMRKIKAELAHSNAE